MGKRTYQPTGRPRADYTGQRRGKLYIEKCLIPSDSFRNQWGLWLCKCECGNIIEVKGESLKSRGRNSCGCLRSEVAMKFSQQRRRPNTLTYNIQYGTFKMRCKQINSPSLSKEEWLSIVLQPCYYCGDIDTRNGIMNSYLKENNITITKEQMSLYNKNMNGIDRVDNAIGYELSNCVPCCTICNRMKSNHQQEEFIQRSNRISIRSSYKNVSLESLLCN